LTLLRSPGGWQWKLAGGMMRYPFVPESAIHTCAQKGVTYAYAQKLGVCIPRTFTASAYSSELEAFLNAHNPVIVKPVRSHGGQGLTLNVTNVESLQAALQHALHKSEQVLVQEQISGQEIRFTIMNGEVVSALLRQTPRLVGDGHSTVAELLTVENKLRAGLRLAYISYPQLDAALVASDVVGDGRRVLADGEILELNRSTMISGGASVYNVTDTVHDSYKQTALLLAQNLSPKFLAIDMMLQNYLQPQTDKNYSFIECNTWPALRLYYSARDGNQYDIVPQVADILEEAIGGNFKGRR
jgi:cyanophycin synthetase